MVKFDIPIYGGSVVLFSDKQEFTRACEEASVGEKTDLEYHCGIVQQITSPTGAFNYLVGVFDKNPMTLVHECGHLTIQICAGTGWDITEETSEPFCYLLEYLVEKGQAVLTD